VEVRIAVLGEVGAIDDRGNPIKVGGPNQRRALAALATHPGRWVGLDALSEAVWPDPTTSPASPSDTLRTYVARLRRVLGDSSIETGDNAYRLNLGEVQVDAMQFEELLQSAIAGPAAVTEQSSMLERAIALWSGPAFGVLALDRPFDAEAHRLEERLSLTMEAAVGARMELGDHRSVLSDLASLVAREPLREEPVRLTMLALYRCGAQVEALRAYQDFRRLLGEETGLDPSDALRDLDTRIARRDPSLAYHATKQQLRGYELHEEIGAGAFGVVHRSVQPGLGRPVAIKVIRKEVADRPEFIRHFEAEAHIIGRLEHPNIVPLYDFWRDPDGAYLVMRFLAGGTLDDRLDGTPQEPSMVARWVAQISSALATAHRRGVLHRDVRPSNIMFDLQHNAYLGDFGLAAVEANIDYRPRARPRDMLYHPPEGWAFNAASPTADIYALGVSTLEALLGRAIEPRALSAEACHAAVRAGVSDLSVLIAPGDEDVYEAVSLATATRPDDRFKSAITFAEALTHSTRHPPVAPESTREIANPYKGLQAFDESDVDNFFGRGDLTAKILDHLTANHFCAVVGPSGSGKSSIVKAGVVPHLRGQGSFIVTMTPGEDPFRELVAAFQRIRSILRSMP